MRGVVADAPFFCQGRKKRFLITDLKAPLSAITGLPEVLLIDDYLTKKQREILRFIKEKGWRMLDMINISLTLLKIEYGDYAPRFETVDILAELWDMISGMGHLAGQLEVSSCILMDGRPPGPEDSVTIMTEGLLCRSIFENLYKNALEASPPGQTVFIRVAAGATTCISLENKGEVPENIRKHFFDKYVTQDKSGGTGLGTYSARLAARALGGDIELDTGTPGQTTIRVFLPTNPNK